MESTDEASVPGEGLAAFWSSAGDIDEPDFAPHVRAEEGVPTSVDLAAGLDILGRQELAIRSTVSGISKTTSFSGMGL